MGNGNCKDMFDIHCKEAFITAKEERKDIRDSLDKLSDRILKTNGKRSVVDCIQDNKKALERHIEETDAPHAEDPIKTKKVSIGKGLIAWQNLEPLDVFKSGMAIVACIIGFLILVKLFYLQGTIEKSRIKTEITDNE